MVCEAIFRMKNDVSSFNVCQPAFKWYLRNHFLRYFRGFILKSVFNLTFAQWGFILGVAMTASAAQASDVVFDPTQPVYWGGERTAQPAAVDALHLQAIFSSSEQNRAVINGRIVKVGDVLSRVTILAIESKRVVVSRDGKQEVLVLAPKISTNSEDHQ